MDDETIVDATKAKKSWEEETDWDGRNHISRATGDPWLHDHISRATGDPWLHEKLYKSAKGRYYIETMSAHKASAQFVDDREAAAWLLKMEHDLPEDLKKYEEEVCGVLSARRTHGS
jgi:hypothetical protein